MWRVNRDETKLSPALLIAWEITLPYRYIPIIREDFDRVDKLAEKLKSLFSENSLQEAAKNIVPCVGEEIEEVIY